jgi:peroxiredoxin
MVHTVHTVDRLTLVIGENGSVDHAHKKFTTWYQVVRYQMHHEQQLTYSHVHSRTRTEFAQVW